MSLGRGARISGADFDDVTYIGPDGITLSKEADLDAHRSGALQIETLEPESLTVRISDGVGITILTARLTGTTNQQPFQIRMRYTRTWAPNKTGWRVVAAHASTITD